MSVKFYSPDTLVSVEFDEAALATGAIARGGYKQKAMAFNPTMIFNDITEQIKWEDLQAADDDTRTQTMQKLNSLEREIMLKGDRRSVDFLDFANRPRLEISTPTEQNTRYALLKALTVPDVDPRHYGHGPVTERIVFAREPYWRRDAPGTAQTITTSALACHDVSATNYISLTTNVTGDAPSPFQLELTAGSGNLQRTVILALRPVQAAGTMGPFYHFMSTRSGGSGGSVVTATPASSIPGDQMLQHTDTNPASSAVNPTMYWRFSDIAPLYGRFQIWGICRATATGDWTLEAQHGIGVDPWIDGIGNKDIVAGVVGSIWNSLYLGNITIPPQTVIPKGTFYTQYDIQLKATKQVDTTSTVEIAGFFLVPVDGQIIYMSDTAIGSQPSVFIDTDIQRVWTADASNYVRNSTIIPQGIYPRLIPGVDHRLYVYNVGGIWDRDDTVTPVLKQYVMYKHFRGVLA